MNEIGRPIQYQGNILHNYSSKSTEEKTEIPASAGEPAAQGANADLYQSGVDTHIPQNTVPANFGDILPPSMPAQGPSQISSPQKPAQASPSPSPQSREHNGAADEEFQLPQEFLETMKQIPPYKHVKVMLVHGSHTGGHRSAAESVKKVLDTMPNVEAEVVNALNYTGGEASKNAQVAATDFVMNKMAPVRGWFFRQSFKGNPLVYGLGNLGMRFKSWMSKDFLHKIQQDKPDVILSCHSPMNSMLSYWKGKGLIDAPVHSVVTDYRVHRMWAQKNIAHYYVASEATKDELAHFGIDKDKIEVSGIPIKPEFARPQELSKSELKEKLGINPEIPMVLMMGGSLGLGRFKEMAQALNEVKTPVQMVCITGKNSAKKAELEELGRQIKMPLTVLGYADNVNEWMDACDVIVSKPGGLTTSEIFARKLPMIILDPMPGLEEMLIPTIVGTGAALSVKGPEGAAHMIEQLCADTTMKTKLEENLEKTGKPFAAYEVASDLVMTALDGTGSAK